MEKTMQEETPEQIMAWSGLPAQPLPSRDEARLVTAELKIKDLQDHLNFVEKELDRYKTGYELERLHHHRASDLMVKYAVLAHRAKKCQRYDRKLKLFFPSLWDMVKEERLRNNV
jgi:hypothetical protein